jgi:Zn-dependent protease with chaperone function
VSGDPAPPARTTFYDELARRRRIGWTVAGICILISAGVGLVLSAVVTPIVLLCLGGLLKLFVRLGLAAGPAEAGIGWIHGFAEARWAGIDGISAALDRLNGPGDVAVLAEPLLALAPAAVPALIAGMLVWLWLRAVFARAAGGDLVLRLGARPANSTDPEERQLANIVEEVAIGAGAPPPRLFVVDTSVANAAALGRSHKDGIVLVTTGLLARLDRSETEAVVARLVSAVGAGDLAAAAGVMATLRTLGFFLTLLDLPLRWSAWRTLGALIRVSVTPRPSAEAVERVGRGLEDGLEPDLIPDFDSFAVRAPQPLRPLARVAVLPWLVPYLGSVFHKLVLFLWNAFALGPPLAWLWRNRCFWTDARTVKLARNPEAFAKALEAIGSADPPPGGEAFAYLFIAAPTAARRSLTDQRSLALALPPTTEQRLARLGAMGAGWRPERRNGPWRALAGRPAAALLVGFLCLLLVPLGLGLAVMIGFLTTLVMLFSLLIGLGVVLWLI